MVKTRAPLMERIIKFVEVSNNLLIAYVNRFGFQKSHPYDSPEVVATEISDGRAEYLTWINENTLRDEDM